MSRKYVHVAPDATSGVARAARNEDALKLSDLQNAALTRRLAPQGGRGVRPYTNRIELAETA